MVTPAARVQFSLDTYVNTPLFQVLTLEFGLGPPARVQGLHLVWLGYFGVPVLNATLFCSSAQAPVLNTVKPLQMTGTQINNSKNVLDHALSLLDAFLHYSYFRMKRKHHLVQRRREQAVIFAK